MPNARPVEAGPTVRRLHELQACGVTIEEIAEAADRPPQVVAALPSLHWVSRATAAAVKRADVLLMGPLPDSSDVDEVAVERLVTGHAPRPAYTRAERHEAIRRMRRLGLSGSDMAARLGVRKRLVQRDVAALGLVETGGDAR